MTVCDYINTEKATPIFDRNDIPLPTSENDSFDPSSIKLAVTLIQESGTYDPITQSNPWDVDV